MFTYWGKQEDIHKSAHAAGQDVHRGPAFLPWHRVLIGRLEALLREADPSVSLHCQDFTAHGYIGGSIAQEHFSFHDPFVFLLHSNVDRMLAAWQCIPGQAWRLDPKQVYGSAAASPTIVQDLQPWSGGSGLRPWAPPDNQQVPTNATDLDVVTPARYDVVLAGGTLAQNADGRVEVFARGDDNALWHIRQTAPNNGWSNWASLGGNIPSLTAST